MPVGSPSPAVIQFEQHVQPLSPFPMGDSPAPGTGYTAPQNTPAVGHVSGSGIARHVSLTPSPYQAVESAGFARLNREEGAMVRSTPAEAPGVQDLLAAFRRAAGQERAPPASPAPAQPDTPGSPMDSPGIAVTRNSQAALGTPGAGEEQASSLHEAAWTDGLVQAEPAAVMEPETQEDAGTAAKAAEAFQGVQAGEVSSADDVAASHIEAGSDPSEAVQETVLAPAASVPAQEGATAEAASSAVTPVGEPAEGPSATETAEVVLGQSQAPEVRSQGESNAGSVTPPACPALPSEEATAAAPALSQMVDSQEMASEQGMSAEQKRSPSKAPR